ncbi:MAG: hypothetical protein PHR26_01445 [Candidatus ainarchaeum sp.]|nr:hypothetical protein [Candidatus ainarchaeum sp.]MDD3976303.1 hypothetical protein [Candidatus ainarchaeum sp.]
MKKILGIIAIAFVFAFLLGNVFAEDVEITETEIQESIDDLENYAQTPYGIEVRLIQLQNTIDQKVAHLEIISKSIEEYNLDVNLDSQIDTFFLESKILELNEINSSLENYLENLNIEDTNIEEMSLDFITYKKQVIDIVQDIRSFLVDNTDVSLRQSIKEEYKGVKQDIRQENMNKIRNLAQNHNLKVKENIGLKISEIAKNKGFEKMSDLNIEERQKLIQEFKIKQTEIKQQAKINKGLLISNKMDSIQNKISEQKQNRYQEISQKCQDGDININCNLNAIGDYKNYKKQGLSNYNENNCLNAEDCDYNMPQDGTGYKGGNN